MKSSRILIVEDDEWLAEQFVRVLNKSEFKARAAHNVISAIDLIDKFKPDALVFDVLLTGGTIFTLLHELQTYQDTSKLPIVICTNIAGDLDFDSLEPYGVRKVLDKSTMRPDDLAAAVRSVLL